MTNELLFLFQTILGLSFALFAFKMGKHWLYGYVAVSIVLANIFVTKQITLFGLSATGGNVVYGSIFLATDLLAEHYGKKEARQAVFIGFFVSIFYTIMSRFVLALIPNEFDMGAADGMKSIFSFAPSIVLASLTAYLVSQLHDVWAFHFLKEKTNGKLLWFRNNASTWLSQLIDSVLFSSLAFLIFPRLMLGAEFVLPLRTVAEIVISTYLLKVLVALIDTPFIYLSYIVKPEEQLSPA